MNLADPVYNLNFQFQIGPVACEDALDTNDDGVIDVNDLVLGIENWS